MSFTTADTDMTKTMFVVTETSFEYNDEVHSVGEAGGGNPVAIFENRVDAETHARNLTIDNFLLSWAGDELHCFGYQLDEIFKRKPSFVEMDEDCFFEVEYEEDMGFKIADLTRDQLAELADCLCFDPHFVTEVPVGQSNVQSLSS